MNPLLRTPEMIIHPPLVFFGYALVVCIYSGHLAGIEQRKTVRIAWAFLRTPHFFLGLPLPLTCTQIRAIYRIHNEEWNSKFCALLWRRPNWLGLLSLLFGAMIVVYARHDSESLQER
ncbi:MAG: hypothetical protein QXN49_01130 [Archaeoglobaceae archaeon]